MMMKTSMSYPSLLLLFAGLMVAFFLCVTSTEAATTTGFTSEDDLVGLLLGLSNTENPEVFLDMNVETTADFLNLTSSNSEEATLAQFLGMPAKAKTSDITRESLIECDPEYSVFGTLKRGAGALANYDFDLTINALESAGLSSLLDSPAASSDDFKAYVLVAPTDDAWVKLKQQLQEKEEGSAQTESLPLQSLVTYSIYGETNQTLFNAVKDVINGTFFTNTPFSFFLNVPIDMLDGNVTVLSTGSSGITPELNGSPILAAEPACNGLILALDDILLPGAAVEKYLKNNMPAGASAAAEGSLEAASSGCTDVPPPSPLGTQWTCQDQQYWGKCSEYWMWESNYCASTCGYCGQSTFPYATAANAQAQSSAEAEAQGLAPVVYDPCACSPDGLSGKVYTGVAGCSTMTVPQLMGMAYASSVAGASATEIGRQFGSRFDDTAAGAVAFNYCYVVEPSKCKKYTEPSPFYEGVRWRFC